METLKHNFNQLILNGKPAAADYDFSHNLIEGETVTCKHSVSIRKDGLFVKSALLNGYKNESGIHKNSQLLIDNNLLVCCSNLVFCLNPSTLELKWKTEVDELCCFDIVNIPMGYLIQGDLAVSKLNLNGELVWQKSGKDLSPYINEINAVTFSKNVITVSDLEGDWVKFNMEGKTIRSTLG